MTITAELELLQLEIGVTGNPLEYDYRTYGVLTTASWIKSLWEKVCHFGIELSMEYDQIESPRGNQDHRIMEIMVTELGLIGEALIRVNRAGTHQEALFLSDIVAEKCRRIERDYLRSWREAHEGSLRRHRTRYEYRPEIPTK